MFSTSLKATSLGFALSVCIFQFGCTSCGEAPPNDDKEQRNIFVDGPNDTASSDAGSTTGSEEPPTPTTDSGVEVTGKDAGMANDGITDIITSCEFDGGTTCEDDEDCSAENCSWMGMCYVVLGTTCDDNLGTCDNPYTVHLPPNCPV
jgi:hypothetical protein